MHTFISTSMAYIYELQALKNKEAESFLSPPPKIDNIYNRGKDKARQKG